MTTDDQRWQTLNRLLAKALEQPPESRDQWIDDNCGDDPEVGAELRRLLTYDKEETGGLADSIAKAAAADDDHL